MLVPIHSLPMLLCYAGVRGQERLPCVCYKGPLLPRVQADLLEYMEKVGRSEAASLCAGHLRLGNPY